jgi:hypothetical protein
MGELDGEVKQMATSRWLGGASWQEALGPARIRLAASSSRSGLGAHLDANFPESLVCRSLFTDGVLPGAEAQQYAAGAGLHDLRDALWRYRSRYREVFSGLAS